MCVCVYPVCVCVCVIIYVVCHHDVNETKLSL